jgi:hypothetical protein
VQDDFDLTICAVIYKNTSILKKNIEITSLLNENAHVQWLLIDNTLRLDTQKSFSEVVNDIRKRNTFIFLKGEKYKKYPYASGSYHHGAAINKALKYVSSKYLLILDPDFIIIRKNWIKSVINFMRSCKLNFFGAPYFPERFTKYRYFPCISCIFIDLRKIPINKIDFRPEIIIFKNMLRQSISSLVKQIFFTDDKELVFSAIITKLKYNIFMKLPSKIKSLSFLHFFVGQSRDTGYILYKNYYKNTHCHYGVLTPNWTNPLFIKTNLIKDKFTKYLVKIFIPDSFCLYPKKHDYSTTRKFSSFGIPFPRYINREEYFWDGKPFAIHFKEFFQKKNPKKITEFNNLFTKLKRYIINS